MEKVCSLLGMVCETPRWKRPLVSQHHGPSAQKRLHYLGHKCEAEQERLPRDC